MDKKKPEIKLNRSNKVKEMRIPQGQRTSIADIYGTSHMPYAIERARNKYMKDLIREHALNTKVPVTSRKAQTAIVQEFAKNAGVHANTARKYYHSNKQEVFDLIDTGIIFAHLVNINYELIEEYQGTADEAEKAMDRTKALDGKANVVKNMADMLSRIQQNETNKDKNQVLREKNQTDMALGAANIAMNFDGTVDEKRELLKNSLRSKKAVRGVVNALKDAPISSDDEDLDVEEFKGVVLDSEAEEDG